MACRKNVLMIIADQFRWDCVGAAGNDVIRTPNLDALAADGVLFRKSFVQTAPCGPSRMCIYTGRYLCSTRSGDNYTPLADAEDNLAWYAREGGYAPELFGYNDYTIDPRTLPEDDPRRTSLRFDNFLPGFEGGLFHEFHCPEYFEYLRDRGYPEALCNPDICETYDLPPEGTGDHLPLRYPALYKEEESEANFLTSRAIGRISDASSASSSTRRHL